MTFSWQIFLWDDRPLLSLTRAPTTPDVRAALPPGMTRVAPRHASWARRPASR
jgi:hypothetical protein